MGRLVLTCTGCASSGPWGADALESHGLWEVLSQATLQRERVIRGIINAIGRQTAW